MSVTIEVPELIASRAAEMGVDIEQEFLEYILRRLNFDNTMRMKIHLELAERFLKDGKKLIDKDPIQASEKLYKAAEEAIKALTICFDLGDILSNVSSRGRWTITDLEKAVRMLKKKVGSIVIEAWDHAWYLHIVGFHEAKLDSEGVRERVKSIEYLIEKMREACGIGQTP